MMLRRASQQFGRDLLSEQEWESIFRQILGGPAETDVRKWLGDEFTAERFQRRRANFHRKQLRPFGSVLFGDYLEYYERLEQQADDSLSDEDYFPVSEVTTGRLQQRSPQTSDALSKLSDADLLEFINLWDAEHWEEDNGLVAVSIEALAETFGTVFREAIIPDDSRRGFWLESSERIANSAYVITMIHEMQRQVELQEFSHLDEWFQFCEWVLSLKVPTSVKTTGQIDDVVDQLGWYSQRRAVADLVGACLREGSDVPITASDRVIGLLETLCTGFDICWILPIRASHLEAIVLLKE